MARPTKSVRTMSKNLTKEEIKVRLQTEENLKGAANNISPPTHLNDRQIKIFNHIVQELTASSILGNLDIYILGKTAVAIDRMQELESLINEDITKSFDKDIIKAKDSYTREFFRCCNELSLSPQSRAKLGTINLQAKKTKEDPLLSILAGGRK